MSERTAKYIIFCFAFAILGLAAYLWHEGHTLNLLFRKNFAQIYTPYGYMPTRGDPYFGIVTDSTHYRVTPIYFDFNAKTQEYTVHLSHPKAIGKYVPANFKEGEVLPHYLIDRFLKRLAQDIQVLCYVTAKAQAQVQLKRLPQWGATKTEGIFMSYWIRHRGKAADVWTLDELLQLKQADLLDHEPLPIDYQ